ncbi:MAG: Spx/MgsR family RNA polymerase-binding regulatory protein [Polyangiaceae bacterium]
MSTRTLLSYAGCSTCRKAISWLKAHEVDVTVRAIVDEPPTRVELDKWVPASGLPLQKWFNTSGQSYRALDKEEVKSASDARKLSWLSKDGKLVKRPVLVDGSTVLVGFDETKYAAHFSKKKKG